MPSKPSCLGQYNYHWGGVHTDGWRFQEQPVPGWGKSESILRPQPGLSDDKGFATQVLETREAALRHWDGSPEPDFSEGSLASKTSPGPDLALNPSLRLRTTDGKSVFWNILVPLYHNVISHVGQGPACTQFLPLSDPLLFCPFSEMSCCLGGTGQLGLGAGKVRAEHIHTFITMRTVLDHYRRTQSNPSKIN